MKATLGALLGFNTQTAERFPHSVAVKMREARRNITFQNDSLMENAYCRMCGKYLRHLMRGLRSWERDDFDYELGNPYDPPTCSDCHFGMYEDLLILEEEMAEELASHPLNQLSSVVGIGRAACDKAPESDRLGRRRKEKWTPTRERANESRERSKSKKPWRRVQQWTEAEKSFIDPYDLGIEPYFNWFGMDYEEKQAIWEDSVNDMWESSATCYYEKDFHENVWDFLDDHVLYGDYPNPYCDLNVEDTLQDQLWAENHGEFCECYDCELEAHRVDWIEYDLDHAYDDDDDFRLADGAQEDDIY